MEELRVLPGIYVTLVSEERRASIENGLHIMKSHAKFNQAFQGIVAELITLRYMTYVQVSRRATILPPPPISFTFFSKSISPAG